MSTDTNLPSRHNFEHLTHPQYRADIDGLRAIAVLSVVAFHTFPLFIKGGFIGVDIFFVISGFLISTIILGSLARNSFSFVEFYSRRIKRIFPALILVLASCFVFGWFALLSDEYKQLGKHIAGGAGFVSNFLFWNESGYFDNAAETKPLLHLWSLGIEEQFYIIWPLLLWLAWKLRFNLLTLTIVIASISFLLNISIVRNDAIAAFYSPQTRFWELLAGSALAHLTLHRENKFNRLQCKIDEWLSKVFVNRKGDGGLYNFQSLVGALLIATGFFVITKEGQFPGWWALFPTMGTVLIISAGAKAWFNRVVLAHPMLVWFGLISFPLYLWHWPMLTFARISEMGALSWEVGIAVVLLSIMLGWLTFRLIEKPIRFRGYGHLKTITLITLMIIVGSVGYNCYQRDGLGFRLGERQAYADYFENSPPVWKYFKNIGRDEKYRSECDLLDVEKYRLTLVEAGRTKFPRVCTERVVAYSHAVFIWGDSHAQQLYFGLKNQLPPDWQLLQVATSGCPPSLFKMTTLQCNTSNSMALKSIDEAKPDVVIVAQNDEHNVNGFNQIAIKLKALGVKKIIFAGPAPHWTAALPKIILKKLWFNTPQRTYQGVDQNIITSNSMLQNTFTSTDTVIFANLINLFCNKDGCLTYIGDDKKTGITSSDRGHLTPIASDYLAKNLLVALVLGTNKIN